MAPLQDGQPEMSGAESSGAGMQVVHAEPARGQPGYQTGLEILEQQDDEHDLSDEDREMGPNDEDPRESRGGDSGRGVLGRLDGPELPAQPAEGHGTALHGQ